MGERPSLLILSCLNVISHSSEVPQPFPVWFLTEPSACSFGKDHPRLTRTSALPQHQGAPTPAVSINCL